MPFFPILSCETEGKGEGLPLPPRSRYGVNSPYLPACGFPAPGDPRHLALNEGTGFSVKPTRLS